VHEVAMGIAIACESDAGPALEAELKPNSRKTSYRRNAQRFLSLNIYISVCVKFIVRIFVEIHVLQE
jgi:hypothetical protein